MAKLNEKDFIEIEYTGIIKEDNVVFDTTDENLAKEEGIYSSRMIYGPVTICIGEGHVLKGLDKELIGKETGKEYEIEVPCEDAFGKKQASLLKLIPLNIFKRENIKPVPGLQIDIDGFRGIVKNVSGGRVIVDFNHPLAGKDLVYKVKIIREVTDDNEKISSLMQLMFNIKKDDVKVTIDNDKKAVIEINKRIGANDKFVSNLKERIQKLVDIKDLELKVEEPKV